MRKDCIKKFMLGLIFSVIFSIKVNASDLLVEACRTYDIYAICKLIKKVPDINATDRYGQTPLKAACDAENWIAARLLLKNGANIDIKNRNGDTLLSRACIYNRVKVAKWLIKNGADINTKNNNGRTPLIEASLRNNKEIVKLLIKNGADVNARNEDGLTFVSWEEENMKKIQSSFEKWAELKGKDLGEATSDRIGFEESLIFADGGSTVRYKCGQTPLMIFISDGRFYSGLLSLGVERDRKEIVKFLINNGADVNVRDKHGRTPLMLLVLQNQIYSGLGPLIESDREGRKEIAQMLIDNGADVNARDEYGNTAEIYARVNYWREIVELLENAEKSENVKQSGKFSEEAPKSFLGKIFKSLFDWCC